MDDRIAKLDPDEVPSANNMCFQWKEASTLCILKPRHDGDHVYSFVENTEAIVEEDETRGPGPGHMCFHYLKPMHRCTLEPEHDGDHWYSEFIVTDITDIEKEK